MKKDQNPKPEAQKKPECSKDELLVRVGTLSLQAVCDIVAGYQVASEMSNDVEGMKSFLPFYVEKLKPEDRVVIAIYERCRANAAKAFLAGL